MTAAGPLRGPDKRGGCAAAVLLAPAKRTGPPPRPPGCCRIALRATALRAALDPGNPCGPWEQEKRAGHEPAPARRGHKKNSPAWPRSLQPKSPRFEGNPVRDFHSPLRGAAVGRDNWVPSPPLVACSPGGGWGLVVASGGDGTRPGPVAARSAVPRGVGHWRFMPRPAATVSWLVHTTHEDRRRPQVAPRRPLTAAAPFFYPGAGQLKARSLSRNRETWLTNSSGYWNSAPCPESG